MVGCESFNEDGCGGLDVNVAWNIVYVAIAIMVIIVIPFIIFYYEADDEGMGAEQRHAGETVKKCADSTNCRKSLCSAICYTGITLVVSMLVLVITFFFLSETRIPFKGTLVSVNENDAWGDVGSGNVGPCGKDACDFESSSVKMDVTFIVYLATLLSFVGWFIFTIYAGIGLVGLPIDGFK